METPKYKPIEIKKKWRNKNMYDIELNIGAVLAWYVLTAIGILLITLYASWKHKTPLPFAWGAFMTVLILWLRDYLAPIIFGVFKYSWSETPLLFTITGIFFVAWFGYLAITLWNTIDSGELIQ